MSGKSRDCSQHKSRTGLLPFVNNDDLGLYIDVCCGSVCGKLYFDKLDLTKKSPGKCVLVNSVWYTPLELKGLAGKKAKQWRQTVLHRGKPLGEYSLTSPLPVSSDNGNNSVQDVLSVQGVNQVLSQHSHSRSRSQYDLPFRLDGDVSLLQGNVRSSTSALATTHVSSCSDTMPGSCPLLVNAKHSPSTY